MRRRFMVVFWVLLVLGIAACGDSSSDGGEGARPATGISDDDMQILNGIQRNVRAWNKAAGPWVEAVDGDSPQRFAEAHRRVLKPLHRAAVGIELQATQIGDPQLRRLVRQVASDYRRSYNAIQDVGTLALEGDVKGSQRALRRVQQAARHKTDWRFAFSMSTRS